MVPIKLLKNHQPLLAMLAKHAHSFSMLKNAGISQPHNACQDRVSMGYFAGRVDKGIGAPVDNPGNDNELLLNIKIRMI